MSRKSAFRRLKFARLTASRRPGASRSVRPVGTVPTCPSLARAPRGLAGTFPAACARLGRRVARAGVEVVRRGRDLDLDSRFSSKMASFTRVGQFGDGGGLLDVLGQRACAGSRALSAWCAAIDGLAEQPTAGHGRPRCYPGSPSASVRNMAPRDFHYRSPSPRSFMKDRSRLSTRHPPTSTRASSHAQHDAAIADAVDARAGCSTSARVARVV